ncbi:MAG: transposase [archaeon]|nr:transposase [archaeon]
MDLESGAVMFSTHGKDSSTLCECAYWIGMHNGSAERIGLVCCDMSPAFISGIRTYFPNATIVFDRFHVEHAAGTMLDDIRRTTGFKGRKGKGIRYEILKNRSDLKGGPPDEWRRVQGIMDEYEDLGRAYSVKQALHDIYCLRDPELQTWLFHRVCGYCLVQENERIQAFGRLLERHRDGIVAYFEYRRTNAVSEGTNSGIQTLKAASKGFKDTEVLIAKI